jgi:hypothetical protein
MLPPWRPGMVKACLHWALSFLLTVNNGWLKQDTEAATYPTCKKKPQPMQLTGETDSAHHQMHFYSTRIATEDSGDFRYGLY